MPIITDAFLFLNSFDIAIDSIPCKKLSSFVDFDNEIIYNFFAFVGTKHCSKKLWNKKEPQPAPKRASAEAPA